MVSTATRKHTTEDRNVKRERDSGGKISGNMKEREEGKNEGRRRREGK